MKTPRQPTRLTAVMAAFFCLLFVSVGISFGQSGPPMPPIIFLNSYSFLTTNWTSDIGDYSPISFTNLVSVSNWGGNSLRLDKTNLVPAYLRYHVEETNGFLNFDLGAGAVYALVVPDWASSNSTQHGHGPGSDAYVLAAGDWSTGSPNGFWGIYINSGGTNIYFTGVSNSVVTNYVSAPISWASNSLHLISLLYSTNTKLFLDGKLAATGGPVKFVPNTNTWTNGFYVGSDDLGYEQFRGDFLYLEFDTTNVTPYLEGTNYYNDDWSYMTNNYYTWLDGGGGGSDDGMGGGFIPPAPIPATNYAAYNEFFLSISNSRSSVYITVSNTLSNLTYEVQTNSNISQSNGWGVWQTFVATNSVTPMPSLALGSNCLYFRATLLLSTTTNGLADYWCMEYFRTLNVNPYADPDGDGLCNLDEYVLGLNPTNAHTLSTARTDAQALLLAYTNNYTGCIYHLSVANGPNTNTLLVTISPTVVGTNYQIYTQASTGGPWVAATNFLGTNTSTTVALYVNGPVSVIGGYGEDSDGDELPDGYEVLATHTDPYLPDTGLTGTPDTYKDPDGDGYVNIVEYYNGTDPLVFNAPAGAQNLIVDTGTASNSFNLTWQPSPGPVADYVVSASENGVGWVTLGTNSPSQLSFLLRNASNYVPVAFSIDTVYSNGAVVTNYSGGDRHNAFAVAAMAYGPGGKAYLITSAANSNVAGYNVFLGHNNLSYPENVSPYYDGSQLAETAYGQIPTNYAPTWLPSFYLAASQFTNGLATLTSAEVPPYSQVYWAGTAYLTPQGTDSAVWPTYTFGNDHLGWFLADPFVDGTTQIKQNVSFLLRAGAASSFSYQLENGDQYYYPTTYVFSSYYYSYGVPIYQLSLDHFAPFEDNYFFANLVFNTGDVGNSGALETGFYAAGNEDASPTNVSAPMYQQYSGTPSLFPTYSYVVNSNQAAIPGLLSSNQSPWVGYYQENDDVSNYYEFGAYFGSGETLGMSNGAVNIYGLRYDSLKMSYPGTPAQFATLSPGNEVSYANLYAWGAGVAQPALQTVNYYFANVLKDPLPEYSGSFTVTNTTPPIFGSVGATMLIAGFAKEAVTNGYANVFAYVGQYFTNAFVVSNGIITTNFAGIVSEYGQFFPTAPGQVALLTKPDATQSNIQGICDLDIIRLSLDVNHDGFMDETFTGPDNTGPSMPYIFWVNNNYDRWDEDTIDQIPQEDTLNPAVQSGPPDYGYYTGLFSRTIPCPRDLEDFARLWVSGISNVLDDLPTGSTVTLSWGDMGNPNTNNPAIDIFQAADADGGIGYLTNLTTASNQINTNICQYVGRLGPGGSIQLNSSNFSNGWAGDHFIWCGAWYGSDQLNLTITDGNGNVLAQSSQYIQLQDIKQMYERWTVGDNDDNNPLPTVVPMSNAVPAQDNFSPGSPQQAFQYSYDPAYDTNDNYILYVHGWNEKTWLKDRWAETAFKRLYWQGYQGRFGEFRWPCFNLSADLAGYDTSEWNAWKSGQSLETFLATLNKNYPNHVYALAHSQGNVVVGEALRLATNQVVNTYVASQAALSARGYDNTLPTNAAAFYTITTSDPQGNYYTNGASSYFSASAGAGKYVNFFNTNDYALMGDSIIPFHPGWLEDQSLKPDTAEFYHYATPTPSIPSGYYIQVSPRGGRGGGPSPTYPLYFPTNTYEIFAMGAQSYSLALGAQAGVNGPFLLRQVNLSAAPFYFGNAHIQHDTQFVYDNMTTAAYWQQLLTSFSLQPTP